MIYYLDYTDYDNGKELPAVKIPVFISNRATKEFQDITQKDIQSTQTEPVENLPILLKITIKEGYRRLRVENPYSDDQLEDIADALFLDFAALITNQYFVDVEKKMTPKKVIAPNRKP
tara:strand:- start:4197 stop:4550 length:354 start_codon:yes stop_codon:yes gene_type:complete